MPVNTYITANGRIRRRITTNGGAVTDQVAVVTNALGSVVATYKDGWLTADRSYDPYGETRAEWNDVGRFGWVGGLGYRETRREWVSHYVRARHYGFSMGMWTSVDPLWPEQAALSCATGRVTSWADPTGKWVPIACAIACGTSAACAAGVWIACGQLAGEEEFCDCTKDYIASLPPHSQIGCGAAALGCLACLVVAFRGCPRPTPVTPPVLPTPTPVLPPPVMPRPVMRPPTPASRPASGPRRGTPRPSDKSAIETVGRTGTRATSTITPVQSETYASMLVINATLIARRMV